MTITSDPTTMPGQAPYFMVPANVSDDGALYAVAMTMPELTGPTILGVAIKSRTTGVVYYNGLNYKDLLGTLVYIKNFLPEVFAAANAANYADVLDQTVVEQENLASVEAGNLPAPTAQTPAAAPPPAPPAQWGVGTILRLVDGGELADVEEGTLAEVIGTPRSTGEAVLVPVRWVSGRQQDGYYHANRFELAGDFTEDDTIAMATYRLQGALG